MRRWIVIGSDSAKRATTTATQRGDGVVRCMLRYATRRCCFHIAVR